MTAFNDIQSIRDHLLDHPLYKNINTIERLQTFMKHHAFAVWDFMSLLTRLQQSLTCVQIPWMPSPHAEYARFINEIVLGEETDEDGKGSYISHFELYMRAMKEIGADTQPILHYLHLIESGIDPTVALNDPLIPATVKEFVHNSLHLAKHGQIHEVTASFFFGREDLIPDMFSAFLKEIDTEEQSTACLRYYLKRHIDLDGDHHGPLAEKLLAFVCKNDPVLTKEAEQVAQHALTLRIHLWSGVLDEIREKGI